MYYVSMCLSICIKVCNVYNLVMYVQQIRVAFKHTVKGIAFWLVRL